MNAAIETALEYFLKRKQTLEDEILRRQMALDEVNLFIANAQDGRSKLRRDAKRGNSETPPTDPELPGTEAPAP